MATIDTAPVEGAAIRARAALYGVDLPPGTEFLKDAAILPGEWPPGLLERAVTIYTAPRKAWGRGWHRRDAWLGGVLVGLAPHPENPDKDGPIAFFGSLGEPGGIPPPRQSENVRTLEALICDIDNGTPLPMIFTAAQALGWGFMAWTSPSSTRTHPKVRVLFPLAAALPMAALGETLNERKLLFQVLRRHVLGGLESLCDPCSARLAQAHNLPRHRPRGLHLTVIQPGPGIVVPNLAELRDLASAGGVARSDKDGTVRLRRPPVDFADPDLRSLRREVGSFLITYGDRLDLVGALEGADWPLHEGSETKRACWCPNDAEHTNASSLDDRGCFAASADDRADGYAVLHCQHAHCAKYTTADLLSMALMQLKIADPLGYLHSNTFETL